MSVGDLEPDNPVDLLPEDKSERPINPEKLEVSEDVEYADPNPPVPIDDELFKFVMLEDDPFGLLNIEFGRMDNGNRPFEEANVLLASCCCICLRDSRRSRTLGWAKEGDRF